MWKVPLNAGYNRRRDMHLPPSIFLELQKGHIHSCYERRFAMQTSRAGTIADGIVQLIFDDPAEYESIVGMLHYFANNMPEPDRCTAIDMKYIIRTMDRNYQASDPLYRGKPTTFLKDDKMQCIINIAFTAIRNWETLKQTNP